MISKTMRSVVLLITVAMGGGLAWPSSASAQSPAEVVLRGPAPLALVAQRPDRRQLNRATAEAAAPVGNVTYQTLWLIESDDVHRIEYSGPARKALSQAGFGRLVPAGSAMAAVSIGQKSQVGGGSRYGQMTCQVQFLNTTEANELQVEVDLRTRTQPELTVTTIVRAPMEKWFLVGSADSRVGLPTHADDGKRAVVIMKVTDEVMILE
ncbi:hypothetical protein [Rhodopirellula sp. P2]|uniref:hypothetical protein n=1 Tax=Rhodopirellula sp. P2 TaxID=2127060 RepID=UPI002367FA24|nr:hypothetical protein [Rhodopirellula sp. P2]WDQ18212.1 hypothetical protein PSR62_06575 [Rhodopirellula sp. P2]